MVTKDTIIGVVGAVILVAALTGVFYYEGSSAEGAGGGSQWDVTWATETEEGPSADGSTDEDETTEETLAVSATNMTDATFTLTWTDDQGSPDTFNLTVTSPTGETRSAEGDSEEISVTFEGVNEVPEEATVPGDSESEAREQAASQYTSKRGQGDWTVEIACVNAGDTDPVGAGEPIEEDTGNSWELSSELTVYVAQLEQA